MQDRPVALPVPEVEVVEFSWRKLPKSTVPSGQKTQEARNAQIDVLIRQASEKEPPDYATIQRLEQLKQNQVTPLDSPAASTRSYEYTFKFKNKSVKKVQSLKFVYQFFDPATQQLLKQHLFTGRVALKPGKATKLVVPSDAPLPETISAQAQNSHKPWVEKVVITEVSYEDGSQWKLPKGEK